MTALAHGCRDHLSEGGGGVWGSWSELTVTGIVSPSWGQGRQLVTLNLVRKQREMSMLSASCFRSRDSRTSEHRVVLTTFKVGRFAQINLMQESPSRHSLRLAPWWFLDPVKLLTSMGWNTGSREICLVVGYSLCIITTSQQTVSAFHIWNEKNWKLAYTHILQIFHIYTHV